MSAGRFDKRDSEGGESFSHMYDGSDADHHHGRGNQWYSLAKLRKKTRKWSYDSTMSIISEQESNAESIKSRKLKIPKFNWRFWRKESTAEKRLIPVGSDVAKDELMYRLSPDPDFTQIKFSNNYTHTSKYNAITFLPLNFLSQFRRASNIYFFANFALTIVLPDSPVSPASWALSLAFVLGITMVKQGYEDYLRHKRDREANEMPVRVIKDGRVEEIEAQYIEVGDSVVLKENEVVPCDMVVLRSSQKQGQCYLMTANLDGETNLKTRMAVKVTKDLSEEEFERFSGYVECENPNPKLDSFLGKMTKSQIEAPRSDCDMNRNTADVESESCSLGPDNLLIAGTVLKNTKEVTGLCVYTGMETKMFLNSKLKGNKFSTIEYSLNRYLIFMVGLMLTEIAVSTTCHMTMGIEYHTAHWYMGEVYSKTFKESLSIALTFMVLYSYIIPISMYVSIEMQKFVVSMFFPWDINLYDEERDIRAKCNTSDINEELGLVTHLFTDKTGTLTRNIMVFKTYSKEGVVKKRKHLHKEPWDAFMMVMTLCHSVKVSESDDEFVASSPDEKALLDACKQAKFEFKGETPDGEMTVNVGGTLTKVFQKLAELEFDSFRKCMSVIVKDVKEEKYYLLSKGAEVAMLPVSVSGPVRQIQENIDEFATRGLRTLVLCYRELTHGEVKDFLARLKQVRESLIDREKMAKALYSSMEQNLTALGATGIEDKLQDKVVETIEAVRTAGIVPWMLTGDKKETAMNLAAAAGIIQSQFNLVDITDSSEEPPKMKIINLHQKLMENAFKTGFMSLVVDGKSVQNIFNSGKLKTCFKEICAASKTVVACRLSPIQKSELVKMMKSHDKRNLTASIGDGGNDISMIQEAHLGLGIIGHEGTAASKSADFAFTQFKCLERALLVHGHWFYKRLSFLVQYSFYKNVACFTCQNFMAIHSNFSGISLYESLFLVLFNTIYAFPPAVIFAVLERNYPEKTLEALPQLYKVNRHNSSMRYRELIKWTGLGFWHAFVSFYGWFMIWPSYFAFGDDLICFGQVISCTNVFLLNVKILLEARSWNWILVTFAFLCTVSYPAITILHSQWLITLPFFANYDVFQAYQKVIFLLPTFLGTILLVIVALLPDVLFILWNTIGKDLNSWRRNRKTYPVQT